MSRLNIKPLSGCIGAEIHGIDLTKPITHELYIQLRECLVEYEVIFFRDQAITPAQQYALASMFGPLQSHPAYQTVEGFPEISILESTADKPTKIECWHSDMTFRQHPPLATVLRAQVVPDKGGDTLWASMTAAYRGLSKSMQDFLSTLTAVHDFSYGFKESLAEPGGQQRLAQALVDNPPVRHPVIRIHPESGKSVIFVNELFTRHIEGLSRSESDALAAFIFEHMRTTEKNCRLAWKSDSIVI